MSRTCVSSTPSPPSSESAFIAPPGPPGMITRHEACRMFGVSASTWVNWQRAGKVRSAGWATTSPHHRVKLYALADLQPLLQQMRGADAVYRLADNRYHIPDGMVGADEACCMFGVHKNVWNRWEREGRITCGRFFESGRKKLYPLAELNRLLAECGRYAPPYPDLPLIEGRNCYWSDHGPENQGHVKISGMKPLHHAIMGVDGTECRVGHLNGDTLDCRRANLVVRTRSENSAGMRKAKTFRGQPCSSRFKGVCWDRRKEKWLAHIKKDRIMRSLGYFDDEIDAAEARDQAARELFGEHARLNFPDRCERGRTGATRSRVAA